MRQFVTIILTAAIALAGCADDSTSPVALSDGIDDATTLRTNAEKVDVRALNDQKENMRAARNFRAHLDGASEVPNAVDTRAQGQAVFRLSRDGSELSYRLVVANIREVVGAHIHMAPEGANGPIVLPLLGNPFIDDPGMTVNGTLVEGTATAGDLTGDFAGDLGALVEAMRMGNTYVNVHTTANRGGEVRGQIR